MTTAVGTLRDIRLHTVDDPTLGETFWQSPSRDTPPFSDDELTDEAEADSYTGGLTRVSTQEFRFYQEGQRLKEEAEATMQPPRTYSSFCDIDGDSDNDSLFIDDVRFLLDSF